MAPAEARLVVWQHHRIGGTDWTRPSLRIVFGKEIGPHYTYLIGEEDNGREASS
jgi:hypothetical protein